MTDDLLPCGHDPLEVWDLAIEARIDGHEATCPYCQGVVTEYRVLAGPTREWRAAAIEAPPALLDRVMTSVRAGLRTPDQLVLASPDGPARISTPAATAMLRWVVDQVDGARARSCRIQVGRPPAAGVESDAAGGAGPGSVVVRLTVVVRSGARIPPLVDEIRAQVGRGGRELLGLEVAAVDIDVEDLWEVTP